MMISSFLNDARQPTPVRHNVCSNHFSCGAAGMAPPNHQQMNNRPQRLPQQVGILPCPFPSFSTPNANHQYMASSQAPSQGQEVRNIIIHHGHAYSFTFNNCPQPGTHSMPTFSPLSNFSQVVTAPPSPPSSVSSVSSFASAPPHVTKMKSTPPPSDVKKPQNPTETTGTAPEGSARRRPWRILLTAEHAIEIYMRRPRGLRRQGNGAKGSGTSLSIAAEYGVSVKTIRDIWNRATWIKATKPLWTSEEQAYHRDSHVDKNAQPKYQFSSSKSPVETPVQSHKRASPVSCDKMHIMKQQRTDSNVDVYAATTPQQTIEQEVIKIKHPQFSVLEQTVNVDAPVGLLQAFSSLNHKMEPAAVHPAEQQKLEGRSGMSSDDAMAAACLMMMSKERL